LLGDERGNVSLETARAEPSDEERDGKGSDSTLLLDDTRNGGGDHNDVAKKGDGERDIDGLESAPVRVRDVRAKERDDVAPIC
jgi:hypothetical protein